MLRLYSLLMLLLWGMLYLPSCVREDSPSGEEGICPGDRLPDCTFVLSDNTRVSTSDLRGKVSVLVFFILPAPTVNRSFLLYKNFMIIIGMMHR